MMDHEEGENPFAEVELEGGTMGDNAAFAADATDAADAVDAADAAERFADAAEHFADLQAEEAARTKLHYKWELSDF